MTEVLATLIILGAASAAVSVTVAWTPVFGWLRSLVEKHLGATLSHLINCHYCIGHWVAAVLVLLAWPLPGWVGLVESWLAVTAFSGILSQFILKE